MKAVLKPLIISLIASSMLLLSSCATLFGDNTREVSVNSYPQNAEVYLNNNYAGKTPTTLILGNIWNSNMVQVKKPGQQAITTEVNSKFQLVGLWNILFWPGFIVDAISGDMMKIAPHSRNLTINMNGH